MLKENKKFISTMRKKVEPGRGLSAGRETPLGIIFIFISGHFWANEMRF